MDQIKQNDGMDEREKDQILQAKRLKSIDDVLEEVGVLIDTHFFNEFTETKSFAFLKNVIANQNSIDLNLFKRIWSSLNCSSKTMKVVREIQENLLLLGKGGSSSQRKRQR